MKRKRWWSSSSSPVVGRDVVVGEAKVRENCFAAKWIAESKSPLEAVYEC